MDSTSSLVSYVQVYSHDPEAEDVGNEFLIQIDDAESGASGDVSLTVEFLPLGTYAITAGSRCDVDGNFNNCPVQAVGTYTLSAEFSAVNPLCTTRVPLGFGEVADGALAPGDCSFTDLGDPFDAALVDLYELEVTLPGFVSIEMVSSAFEPRFEVRDTPFPGRLDDYAFGHSEEGSWLFYLPVGSYTVAATANGASGIGEYSLSFVYDEPNLDACEVTIPIGLDETVDGSLKVDDCFLPGLGIYSWESFVDLYRLTLPSDGVVTIEVVMDWDVEPNADLPLYGYSLSVSAVPEPGWLLLQLSALGSLAVAYMVSAKRRNQGRHVADLVFGAGVVGARAAGSSSRSARPGS
jgi:hypothetical protein